MFHQAPAGLDEALLQAGQRPAVDPCRQHEPPPQVAEIVGEHAQLQADLRSPGTGDPTIASSAPTSPRRVAGLPTTDASEIRKPYAFSRASKFTGRWGPEREGGGGRGPPGPRGLAGVGPAGSAPDQAIGRGSPLASAAVSSSSPNLEYRDS